MLVFQEGRTIYDEQQKSLEVIVNPIMTKVMESTDTDKMGGVTPLNKNTSMPEDGPSIEEVD